MKENKEIIYVAGPYTAPTIEGVMRNVNRAVKTGVRLMGEGKIPIVPHALYCDFERYSDYTWKDYMKADLEILKRVDSIYLMENWEKSRGARIEERCARWWGKKRYYEFMEGIVLNT